MAFFTHSQEGWHQFANSTYVLVYILISRICRCDVVRVQHCLIIITKFSFQSNQFWNKGQHAFGAAFFVANCGKNHIALKVFNVLGDFFHHCHNDGNTGLHIKNASAEKVFSGVNIIQDFLIQRQFFQFFYKNLWLSCIVSQNTIVRNTNGISVTNKSHSFLAVAFFAV